MTPRTTAVVSWSSGKDSALALHEVRRSGEVEVVGVLTTITSEFGRVSMHGVREALLDQQAEALGLRCWKIPIPSPCPNEIYEREMARVLGEVQQLGVTAVVFGALFLEDLRRYREAKLAEVGMRGIFPLWMRDTAILAREMIELGIRATLTCIDPKKLDRSFAGPMQSPRVGERTLPRSPSRGAWPACFGRCGATARSTTRKSSDERAPSARPLRRSRRTSKPSRSRARQGKPRDTCAAPPRRRWRCPPDPEPIAPRRVHAKGVVRIQRVVGEPRSRMRESCMSGSVGAPGE